MAGLVCSFGNLHKSNRTVGTGIVHGGISGIVDSSETGSKFTLAQNVFHANTQGRDY